MEKINTQKQKRAVNKKEGSRKKAGEKKEQEQLTIGLDLGDKNSSYCMLDEAGEVITQGTVATTAVGIERLFEKGKSCRIAMEAGTHSAWVSRLLKQQGHEVIVANPRKLKLITASDNKTDRMDAELLARLARADIKLLKPIEHRSEQGQSHLLTVRVRAALVETRTALINAARGLAKATGERLPKASPESVTVELGSGLKAEIRAALEPVLKQVESLNERIKECDKRIEEISELYPEVKLLQQVKGVGPVIALTFVLTIDNAKRFEKSRDVGCFLGLRPKRKDSGESSPQLGITKAGDRYLRTLLVNGAQYILGRFGPDTDLRRWGLRLAGNTGDKRLKKRAVVAVARKLAVLLHRLWVTGEVYEPLRNSEAAAITAA